MSFISKIFSGGISDIVSSVGDTVKKFVTTDKDRLEFQRDLENILTTRMSKVEDSLMTELGAKERIIVAELQQGDKFTKRARPSVVYFGLVMIFVNYCIMPTIQYWQDLPITRFDLPSEFWYTWGAVVSTWSVGRTMEKKGIKNKFTSLIMGD